MVIVARPFLSEKIKTFFFLAVVFCISLMVSSESILKEVAKALLWPVDQSKALAGFGFSILISPSKLILKDNGCKELKLSISFRPIVSKRSISSATINFALIFEA